MNCVNHEQAEGKFMCNDCGVSICSECAVNNNNEVICLNCAKDRGLVVIKNQAIKGNDVNNFNGNRNYQKRRISGFWSTLFSFIPGAGHMYIGLMKKGLQIMATFFLTLALGSAIYSNEILPALGAIIWFYSVFDCFHIRRKLKAGEDVKEDLLVDINLENINFFYVGIGLIVFGGIIFLDELALRLAYMLNANQLYNDILRIVRSSIFPVLLILGGIFLTRLHKKDKIQINS